MQGSELSNEQAMIGYKRIGYSDNAWLELEENRVRERVEKAVWLTSFGKKDVSGFTWLVVCMKTITRGSVTSSDIESVNNINELK